MKKIDGVIECRFHLGSSGGEELWHHVLVDGSSIIKILPCAIGDIYRAKVMLVGGDVMDLDIPYSVMVDCVRDPGKYFDNGLWKWSDEGRDHMQAAEWTPANVKEYLKKEGDLSPLKIKFNLEYIRRNGNTISIPIGKPNMFERRMVIWATVNEKRFSFGCVIEVIDKSDGWSSAQLRVAPIGCSVDELTAVLTNFECEFIQNPEDK